MSKYKNIPITKIKIICARILYLLVTPFFGEKNRIIRRKGIYYEIDPSEGIDLSLFLFGNFQKHVTNNKFVNIQNTNEIIIDIGANFGLMALQFAKNYQNAQIFAFEPTHYAYARLKRNIELNPDLMNRIKYYKVFISDKTSSNPQIKAYSSWRVDGRKGEIRHPIHGGSIKSTEGIPSITLDDFCKIQKIDHIDLIKIDTDGHEYEVLNGGIMSISEFRPFIIFEIGQYVMIEKDLEFSLYIKYFAKKAYKLFNVANGDNITIGNYEKKIPHLGTIDIIAIPKERLSEIFGDN